MLMRKHTWVLPAAVLALGACFLTLARARDDDEEKKIEAAKKALPDVQKLAEAAGKPDELKKQADAISKKYDELLPIMWQMKPVSKGGMQIGKPNTFQNDSIELGLLQMGKKPPMGKDLADKAADIQKLAEVTRGIAEVAPHYAKKFTKTPAEEKEWNKLSEDMAKSSDDLNAAAQKADGPGLKKAVNNLNKSCDDCHTKFRDN
jgi:cytochrome c556